MSAKATFWAWEQSLTSNRKLVLLAYANYSNDNDESWPSKETVARITGLSKATVKRAVIDLCESGHLIASGSRVSGRTGDGIGRETILYRIACTGVTVNPVHSELGSPSNQLGSPCTPTGVTVNPNPNNKPNKEPTSNSRFAPPSISDVVDYCNQSGKQIDAERFVDFYESKGWMVGKNKMKDWKAAVRNWAKAGGQNQNMGTRGKAVIADLNDRSWAS